MATKKYAFRNYIDGLEKVEVASSVSRVAMPTTGMAEIGEVYEGGVQLKREAAKKTRHYQEGKFNYPVKTQSRPGPMTGTFKLLIRDLEEFAAITGGTITYTGDVGEVGSATYISPASQKVKPVALKFYTTTKDVIGPTANTTETAVGLEIYRAMLDIAEDIVMNDKGLWLADVSFEMESSYQISGVAVDVTEE